MNTVLETERLILRPFTLDDFEAFAAMYADPRVAEFVTEDGKPLSRFAAWRAMAGIVGHWTLRGFGLFAVLERETGTFVGRIGPWNPEGWPDFEIGWTLRSEYWGRGYASVKSWRVRLGFPICPIEKCCSTVYFVAIGNGPRPRRRVAGPAKAGPYVLGGRAWRGW